MSRSLTQFHVALAMAKLVNRLRAVRQLNKPIKILVYQMGKVGSQTVCRSLKKSKVRGHVHHIHYLTHRNLNKYVPQLKDRYLKTGHIGHNLLESRYLRRKLDRGIDSTRWKIVTLVRDPVAICVSGFLFRRETIYQPGVLSGAAGGIARKTFASELRSELLRFLDDPYNFEWILLWFDVELKSVFGLDLYREPFAIDRGYQLYNGPHPDALLIRTEDLGRCATEAFNAFLDVEDFQLRSANRADDLGYGELYREFLTDLSLPASVLDRIYESKLCQHFYSESELRGFKDRWSQ